METLSRDRQITLLRGRETGCYFPHWETLADLPYQMSDPELDAGVPG